MDSLQMLLKVAMMLVMEMEGQSVLEWMRRLLAMKMVHRLGWRLSISHWTCF